ncbi:hypothetical protein MD484_g460, partial [Candolleomyces efflorescens]
MADSPTVYEPTCHPGTRVIVSDRIMGWARDRKATPILWLSGPAGAGKSCIQRTIVQSSTAEGLFVACFFFSIKSPEASTRARFVATLAFQLAENIPGLKGCIKKSIKNDHRVFTKTLEAQVQGLILQPFQELDGSWWNRLKKLFRSLSGVLGAYQGDERPNVIVIDGLDECANEEEQRHILRLIHALVTQPHFPFRFAIASRPEYAIRTAFSSAPLSDDTLALRLEDYEADGDVRRFLHAEFSRLKQDHPSRSHIPEGWPFMDDENMLVTKASKQFVYVSVVMKHLANPRRDPMKELQQILDYRPSDKDTNPFTELDALYDRILHPPDIDPSILKCILHSIIHDKPGEYSAPPVDDLDVLLGLTPGTTMSTLVDLHSLLNFNSPTPTLRPTFHHKSLEDFLTSESRAGDLYQSSDQTHVDLTLAYHRLGQQRRGAEIADIWHPCLLAASHACAVSDWSLFDRDFAKDTLPEFVKLVFVAEANLRSRLKAVERNGMAVHHSAGKYFDMLTPRVEEERRRTLDPYCQRYHSFFVRPTSLITFFRDIHNIISVQLRRRLRTPLYEAL